jgi:cytochrome P450
MTSTRQFTEEKLTAVMGILNTYSNAQFVSLGDHLNPRGIVLTVVLLLAITWLARRIFRPDLRSIPGPFLASVSNFYRLAMVLRGQSHWENIKLHQKYVSINDPGSLPTIYGIAKGFRKSDFYVALDVVSNGQLLQNMFATQSDDWHRAQRKPVAHAYAMSTLTSYEPLVDSTTSIFMDAIGKRFASSGETCNLAQWLQWYAFDVIGEITFSKRLPGDRRSFYLRGTSK